MTDATRRVALPLAGTGGGAPARGTSGPEAVTAVVHEPQGSGRAGHIPGDPVPAPVLLLPGAGGSLDTEPLVALAEVVAVAGHPVVRANLPHHERGGPAPRASRSVPAVAAILAAARAEVDGDGPWVLGGRSYGARVVSMAIADGLAAAGLLCSGYPLHPPGRPEELRIAHWPRVGVPVLFIQGDADPMAEPALLATHRPALTGGSEVVVVAGGDHALRVTRARSPDGTARSPAAATHGVAGEVAAWLHGLAAGPGDAAATGRGPDG